MRCRKRSRVAVLAVVLVVQVGGGAASWFVRIFRAQEDHRLFRLGTSVYPGDDVRVAGVKVGTIVTSSPRAPRSKVTLNVDHGVPIPADAKAVIVAQNLVDARYVQLTPAYESSGPTMADGAVISARPDRRTRRVGRGEGATEQARHGSGTQRRGIDHLGGPIHRERSRRNGWQRRQTPADDHAAVRNGAHPRRRRRQTSPTSSRIFRCSSRRFATATHRSCRSRTGSPPCRVCWTTAPPTWMRP